MAKVELWQEPGAVFSDWSTAVHAVYRSKGSKTFSFFHTYFVFLLFRCFYLSSRGLKLMKNSQVCG